MAHRKFGVVKNDDKTTVEPIAFDLADETDIACRSRVNGKLLIELVGKVDSGSVARQAEGILQVFGVCVLTADGENPEKFTGKAIEDHSLRELTEAAEDGVEPGVDPTSSLGRLNSVLNDPATEIDVNELAELVGWLVEQYTSNPGANPKGKSSSSLPGTTNTQPTSRARRRRAAGTGGELNSVPVST
jgi:hypothetical protein